MRILKKSLALTVVAAMLLSLVSFGVFADAAPALAFGIKATADATSTINGAKAGKTVYIDVNVTAGEYKSLAVAVKPLYAVTNEDVTVNYPSMAANPVKSDGTVQFSYPMQMTITEGTPLMTIKMTIPAGTAAGNVELFTYEQANNKATVGSSMLDIAVGASAFEVKDGFVAHHVDTIAPVNVELGTAAEAVVLPSSVTVLNEAGDKNDTLAVGAWTSADYNAEAVGAYTFTADVIADENKAAELPAEGLKATATVNVNKIAEGITADAGITTFDLVVTKDSEGVETEQNAAAVAAAVAAALENKVTLKKGNFSEVVTLDATAFVADAAVTNVGDTATVTITVPTDVTADKFAPASAVTTTVAVTVIPDVITDIEWKLVQNLLTPSREVVVELTYAGADYVDAPVEVEATLNGEGATTLVGDPAWTLPNDGDDAVLDVVTISLGTVKDLYAAAKAGDVLTLTVKVNGSPVQVVVDDLGEAIVSADFAITADGVSGGSMGLPTGGSKPSVPTTPEDPEDPTVDPEDPAVDPEDPAVDPEDPATPVAGLFEDVPADHWAVEYIKEMKDMGVVSGKTATTFEPDAIITRAEFVKMIAVTFGLEIGANESAFEDCGADDWYTPYVVAAAEAGYVNGISATAFGANDAISRQDICTILGRILGLTEEEAEATFADIDDIADYALNAVKALAAAGILNGYEDGTFAPTKNATRAEVCKILSSLLALVTEEAPEEEAAEEEAVVEDVVEEEAAEEEAVVEEATEEVEEEVVEEEVVDEK